MLSEKVKANLALAEQLARKVRQLSGARAEPDPTPESECSKLSKLVEQRDAALRRLRERDEDLLRARTLLVSLARQLDQARRGVPRDPALSEEGLLLRDIPEDFDEESYLALYPDAAQAVRAGAVRSGYQHWLLHGRRDGRLIRRNKHRLEIPADFDEEGYLALNPDVAADVAAGKIKSGYRHWVEHGIREGRPTPRPDRFAGTSPVIATDDGFDEDAYLLLNPDIAASIQAGRIRSAYHHWIEHGRFEGRHGGPVERVPERSTFLAEMEARPYGVNFYGFFSTASGIGSVSRGCAQALRSQSIPFHPIDIPPWKGGLEIRRLPEFSPYRINLIHQHADVFDRFLRTYGMPLLNGAYNIGYWAWELPSARTDWFHVYQYVDEIWVQSEFNRQSFQTLTPLPVTLIPPVVDGLEQKAIHGRKHFGIPEDVFVFSYIFDVSSYIDRKNPFCLIEAFKRAFGGSRDVLLFLKYFNNDHDQSGVRKLQEAIRGAANIRAFSALLSDEEIVSLHKAVDCFVSPHRSEGFGMNVAESMYFGKPVIATAYSATVDFLDETNGYPLDYRLKPIAEAAGPYVKGGVWADPLVEHLASLLRRVFERPEERQEKGRLAARTIRDRFSTEAIGRRIRDRFEQLGLDRPHLARSIFRSQALPVSQRLFPEAAPYAVRHEIRQLRVRPVISIVTPVYNIEGRYLRACIESVRAQWYPFWELCLCDDGSTNPETLEVLEAYRGIDGRIKITRSETNRGIAAASNRAAEISTGEYLAMLDNDDELAPDALYEIAKAVTENPLIDVLYTDEDKIEEDGRYSDHYFKPDWSPDHLRSVMYLLHLLVVRKELFYTVGGFRAEYSGAQDYDLALRATARARAIHHVPKILYHWRKIRGSAAAEVDAKPLALQAGFRALEDFLKQSGTEARVEAGKLPGLFRVRYTIAGNPLASLCIPTGDRWGTVPGRGKINLVSHFVRSIAQKTDYPNYEIVVCDDCNLSPQTREALRGINYRLINYTPSGPFNYAAKVNFMLGQAKGEHLVLLNDDMEIITAEWLTALIEFTQQKGVGIAGARLLFPDNRVQHAGVVIGVNDGAAHIYHGAPASFVGYNAFTHLIRNYAAVTAACMAMRREVWKEVGKFDERLAVDYNDIDFCLSVLERGYRIVYTPYAELYHFEGKSCERKTQNPKEVALFRERWMKYIERDPYYNPNLTRRGLDFAPLTPEPEVGPLPLVVAR
jgi:GT2 family glycosyltransferase/glycosyltransferase involved in cell wall biosynthesis